jgi:hypothetical protein
MVVVLGAGTGVAEAATASDQPTAYRRLEMLLEKTFLQIDAARAVLELPPDVADSLHALAAGRRCDDVLRDEMARYLRSGRRVDVTLTFLHGFGADRFFAGGRDNVRRLEEDGLLDRETVARLIRDQRRRFAFLADRGIEDGDRLFYRLRGDTLDIRFVDAGGVERVNETQVGRGYRVALWGAYLHPESEFRRGLLDSVCD